MATPKTLIEKMNELAASGHPRAEELRRAALALWDAQDLSTKSFLGAWARARRIWSECSGEPLL